MLLLTSQKNVIQKNKFGLLGEAVEKIGNWTRNLVGMDGKSKEYTSPTEFSSMSDLFSTKGWEHDFGKDVRDENAVRLGAFYDQWSNYLSTTPQVLTYIQVIPQFFARSFYGISMALESAYSALFNLFGFFDYLGDSGSYIGQIFSGLRLVGTTLFILLLVVKVTASFFSKPLPYGEVFNSLILATMVSSFLPQALQVGGTLTKDITSKAMGLSENGSDKKGSLSIVPIQNNIVDVKQLLKADFNTSELDLDSQGYVSFNSKWATSNGLNKITDANFMHTDLTSWYGASDKEVLEWFKKNKNTYHEGTITLFIHKLGANDEDQVEIKTIKESKWLSKNNIFTPVYLRYRVNWLGLLVQQLLIIAVLFSMGIKLVQSIISILIGSAVAPFVVYTSVGNTAKIKDVILTLISAFIGINIEVIMTRFALIVMRDGVGMVSENLGFWSSILVSIMIYFGAYMSIINGNQMVERWLGVSTAQNGGRQFMGQVARSAMTAYALGKVGGGVAKAPGKALGAAKGFGDATKANGGGLKGASKTLGNKLRQPEYDARQKMALDGQNLDKHGNDKTLGGAKRDENGNQIPGTDNKLTGNEGLGYAGAAAATAGTAGYVGAKLAGKGIKRSVNGARGLRNKNPHVTPQDGAYRKDVTDPPPKTGVSSDGLKQQIGTSEPQENPQSGLVGGVSPNGSPVGGQGGSGGTKQTQQHSTQKSPDKQMGAQQSKSSGIKQETSRSTGPAPQQTHQETSPQETVSSGHSAPSGGVEQSRPQSAPQGGGTTSPRSTGGASTSSTTPPPRTKSTPSSTTGTTGNRKQTGSRNTSSNQSQPSKQSKGGVKNAQVKDKLKNVGGHKAKGTMSLDDF